MQLNVSSVELKLAQMKKKMASMKVTFKADMTVVQEKFLKEQAEDKLAKSMIEIERLKKELDINIEENFRREKAEAKLEIAQSEITLLTKELDQVRAEKDLSEKNMQLTEEKRQLAESTIDLLRKEL